MMVNVDNYTVIVIIIVMGHLYRTSKGSFSDENLERKSISAASKSELIRGLTTDKRLHIISTEVTS